MRVELPLAPTNLTEDGIAQRFDQYPRTGARPLLVPAGPDLRTHQANLVVAGRDTQGRLDAASSIEGALRGLRRLAASGERIKWHQYGPGEHGWFRITTLSVNTLRRRPSDHAATLAEVSLTLTEASDPVTSVGPVSGGAKTASAPLGVTPAAAAAPAKASAESRTHTVMRGETPHTIAQRYYGDGARYHVIADANDLSNPNLLRVGQVLTIPPLP